MSEDATQPRVVGMPLMTRDDAFLDDIRRHPDDDAPRLIYADWLDDHDDAARAEFIRVQCELARPPAHGRRAAREALEAREEKLLRLHQNEWLAQAVRSWADRWRFERGFVVWAAVAARRWVEQAADVLPLVPLLHAARFLLTSGCLVSLAGSPHLARLSELQIVEEEIGEAGAEALAASPQLAGLAALILSGNDIRAGGAAALVNSPNLSRLERLDLAFNALGPAGAAALAASPGLARLRRLRMSRNALGRDGVRALAASPHVARLETLDLDGNHVGPAGARALAASPHLGRLRELSLARNGIGDSGAITLARSGRLARLERLELAANDIKKAAAAALRKTFGDRVHL